MNKQAILEKELQTKQEIEKLEEERLRTGREGGFRKIK